MNRRITRPLIAIALSTSLALLFLPAAPAGAWGNGGPTPDAPEERDGYGTHDWIVDKAVASAGSAGTWLRDETARLASDDPDTLGRSIDSELDAEHLYREKGTGRGAVHEISEYYNAAIAAHKAGNLEEASRQFGLLSHHYADIMVPYHAAYAGLGKDTAHHEYEKLVDQSLKDANDKPGWYAGRAPVEVANIRKHASAAAAYSRAKFNTLHSSFTDTWSLNSTVSGITKAVLSRAANDLGDVLKTIPLHRGRAPGVGSLSSSVKWRYIGQNMMQGLYIRAKGTDGRAIEGLAVDVAWLKPEGGTTQERLYTDVYGKAKLARNVGNSPLMVRRGVKSIATTGSLSKSSATWYMTSPKLHDGTTGFSARPSSYYPTSTVSIRATARDTRGNPVEGLLVDFTWHFKGRTIVTTDYTNANGVAISSRDVSRATNGYTVYVYTHVQSGGGNRYYKTKFTP